MIIEAAFNWVPAGLGDYVVLRMLKAGIFDGLHSCQLLYVFLGKPFIDDVWQENDGAPDNVVFVKVTLIAVPDVEHNRHSTVQFSLVKLYDEFQNLVKNWIVSVLAGRGYHFLSISAPGFDVRVTAAFSVGWW